MERATAPLPAAFKSITSAELRGERLPTRHIGTTWRPEPPRPLVRRPADEGGGCTAQLRRALDQRTVVQALAPCYERSLKRDPQLRGRVLLRVRAKGRRITVRLIETTIPGHAMPGLERCLARRLTRALQKRWKRWKRWSVGGECEVGLPIVFAP